MFPRSEAVKEFLKTYAHSERQRKRDEYTDRGIGTLQDGYTTEQHIKISNYYLMENSLVGLRSRFDHLYGHACTLRGLDRRDAELADLFSIDLPQMKWHSKAYITLMDHGKTNQAGRKEVGAMIRHKNLDICPVSAMFQYLFARFYTRSHLFLSSLLFHCCLYIPITLFCHPFRPGKRFPDLSEPEAWYETKLLVGDRLLPNGADPEKTSISYNTQRTAVKRAFNAVGVVTSKATHAQRGTSVRDLGKDGSVHDSEMRRQGRWNGDAMETFYLTGLPLTAMAVLAGFKNLDSAYLPRATLEPPEGFPFMSFL